MATSTNPSTLANQASCFFSCIPDNAQTSVIAYVLLQIANGLGMNIPTNPATLANLASCQFSCLPLGIQNAIIVYLLDQINIGGGVGGATLCGAGSPVGKVTPTSTCALYINTTDGSLWQWYNGTWH